MEHELRLKQYELMRHKVNMRKLIGEPYKERLREYKSWEFPSKNIPWIVPTCIDIENRYVSLVGPEPDRFGRPNPRGEEYEEYVIGADGKFTDHRKYNGFNAEIQLRGDVRLDFFYSDLYHRNTVRFGLSFLPPGETVSNAGSNFGSILYDKNLLIYATFACVFLNRSDDRWKRIYAPEFGARRVVGSSKSEWNLNSGVYTPKFWGKEGDENSYIFIDDENNAISRGSWQVSVEDDIEFLVLRQTLLNSEAEKISRVLKVPTEIDAELVRKVTLLESAKERSPQDGKSRLVARWRDIGKVIGATLNYKYPIPEGIKIPNDAR